MFLFKKTLWRALCSAQIRYSRSIQQTAAFHLKTMTAITLAGVTNLRFPGGTGEVLNNLLVGSTSDTLAPDLVAFLEWVSTKNAQGFDLGVTLVLPTKTHSTFEDVYNFANT